MSNRLWSTAINDNHAASHFPYIYDPTAVISGSNPIQTGAWRPYTINDITTQNVSISGGVSISSVAVTGGSIAISNTPNVNVNNNSFPVTGAGGFFGITGTPNVNVTNPVLAVSGNTTVINTVTINSGSFALTPGIITSSQAQIPVGVRSYFIAIISGNAWVNGVGPMISPFTIGGGGYDGHWILNTAINFGVTGGFITYGYES
jgi:hypothetical protein